MRKLCLLALLAGLLIILARQDGWTLQAVAASLAPRAAEPDATNAYNLFAAAMNAEAQALERLRQARDDAARRDALLARDDAYRRDAPRLLALAESAPDDPAAMDALLWLVQRVPGFPEGQRAADLLVRDHVRSPRLMGASPRLAESGSETAVRVLRSIARDHPTPTVRAEADQALGRILKRRSEQTAWRDPARAQSLAGEARDALSRALAAGRDQANDPRSPLGRIRSDLVELDTLRPGEPAPDIEGTDVDGSPMRLRDYRGKVVALTFWGDWCSLCWNFYPYQRALVTRLRDRPFAMVGVSTDSTEDSRLALRSGKVSWPSWVDGGQVRGGPIARAWNVTALPVTFVIDDCGVIRYKVGAQDDDHDTFYFLDSSGKVRDRWQARAEELSEVVEALVIEAETRPAKSSD
jgi:peroxiredoxin